MFHIFTNFDTVLEKRLVFSFLAFVDNGWVFCGPIYMVFLMGGL